jgi:hypothetical protein
MIILANLAISIILLLGDQVFGDRSGRHADLGRDLAPGLEELAAAKKVNTQPASRVRAYPGAGMKKSRALVARIVESSSCFALDNCPE